MMIRGTWSTRNRNFFTKHVFMSIFRPEKQQRIALCRRLRLHSSTLPHRALVGFDLSTSRPQGLVEEGFWISPNEKTIHIKTGRRPWQITSLNSNTQEKIQIGGTKKGCLVLCVWQQWFVFCRENGAEAGYRATDCISRLEQILW